jgi:hypothetical protein
MSLAYYYLCYDKPMTEKREEGQQQEKTLWHHHHFLEERSFSIRIT